ncbi:MAG: hypothetical protein J6S76_06945, partial [Clostridia bacterium]|nr:hypothetical protein [Clostridia bacterium]
QTTLSQYSKYKEDYAKGKITQQEYREYLILYGEAYVKNEPFKRIEQHLSYADELSAQGREAWFVYDTGWKTFLNADFDWPLYVLQLLLFSGVFIIEHASRSSNGAFHTILRTTKNGRSVTFKCKILSTAALSTVLYGIFLSIDLFYLSSGFDLPLPQAPLHSLPFMSASVPGVSIKAFCILYAAARLLANIAFSIFVVTISSLIKKLTPALTVITFITLMPHLLSRSGFHALSCVDYTAVLRFTPLLLDNLPGLIFALLFAVCTLTITICARRRWIH